MLQKIFKIWNSNRIQTALNLFIYFPIIWSFIRLLRRLFKLPSSFNNIPIDLSVMSLVFIILVSYPKPIQNFFENWYKSFNFQRLLYLELYIKEHLLKWWYLGKVSILIFIWFNIFLIIYWVPFFLPNESLFIISITWLSVLKVFFSLDGPFLKNVDIEKITENRENLSFDTILKSQTALTLICSNNFKDEQRQMQFPYVQRRLMWSKAKSFGEKAKKAMPEFENKVNITQIGGGIATGFTVYHVFTSEKRVQERWEIDRQERLKQWEVERQERLKQWEIERQDKLKQQEIKWEIENRKLDIEEYLSLPFIRRIFTTPKTSNKGSLKLYDQSIINNPQTAKFEVESLMQKSKTDFNCVLESRLKIWELIDFL